MTDHLGHARQRRRTLGLLFAAASGAILAGGARHAAAAPLQEIRIGYQKYGTLTLLKGRATLEPVLAAKGIKVKWTEFPAGAGLAYVGNEPPSPQSEAIVVPKTSPLRSLAELKGKKIALNKGSNVHYLLVKALEKAGVAWRDIQPVYLPPADARAAFERGAVDAWAIWDPFLAAAEKQLGARVLATGQGLVANHQFYLSSRDFARQHPQVVRILLDEIAKVDAWGKAHPQEVGTILAAQTGLPPEVVALAAGRYAYGVKGVTAEVLRAQQDIADAFYQLKLIPKPIAVRDAQPPAELFAKD
jgi:sulfonate transport system substrate-binding protein